MVGNRDGAVLTQQDGQYKNILHRDNTPAAPLEETVEQLRAVLVKVEQYYNAQVDDIKSCKKYQTSLADLHTGAGVRSTLLGSYSYHAEGEKNKPGYAFFDGCIFLKLKDDAGGWAVNSGYGDIPARTVVRMPQAGEAGYGACPFEWQDAGGHEMEAFLRGQAQEGGVWDELLAGLDFDSQTLSGLHGGLRVANFRFLQRHKTGTGFGSTMVPQK